MTSSLPLILSEETVTKGTRSMASRPHVAVVYADVVGQVSHLGRPLSRAEARRGFRTRYEVDLSDHRRTAQLDSSPLPSRGDAYFFRSKVDVGFRVSNPEAVVKRHVTDALAVVYGYLSGAFWPVTRRFEIRDAEKAEAALNELFLHDVVLDEGITIYRCVVQLLPDTAAQEYLRALESADRTLFVGEAQHTVATAEARRAHELASLAQRARLDAESREQNAMASSSLDFDGLIRAHLAKHPDETAYALELLQRHYAAQNMRQDIDDKRSLDLVRYMIEQGMIHSVDLDVLRKQALGRVQEIASPARPVELPAASWDDPLPSGPVLRMAAESTPVPHDDAPQVIDASRTVPVYVVFDESPTDPAYFNEVNRGMGTLPADLAAAQPEIVDAVRLAVLGYAGQIAVRMPLTKIAPNCFVPELTARPGSSLSSVFEYLPGRIADDVSRLKSQGLTVGRPILYLLCAATPGESSSWESSLLHLADRAEFALAPNILACGIGATDAEVIRKITAQPQSSGWVADPGTPLNEAVSRYTAFVRQSIAVLGRAHLTGGSNAASESPAGFRSVNNSAVR